MAEPLVVIGSGGQAKVIVEAVLALTPDREIIILDDSDGAGERSVLGIRVSGNRDALASASRVIPAVGNNEARAKLIAWLLDQGHELETVLHPSAVVAESVSVGPGSFVAAGAIVIAEAKLGVGAIVNTGATVDHDCAIGDAAHIAPGVHLCGNVRVGARSLVGVGTSVRPGISICDDVTIGAGSVVVADITERGTFVGNPARRLR